MTSHFLKKTAYLTFSILIFSCNTSEKKKIDAIENVKVKKEHVYTIDVKGVSVLWTAYKFTDKLGVSGKFDDFKLSLPNEAESIEGLLENSKIEIYTESVNSNSEIRDPKLKTSFFKVFNTSTIKGTILEANQGKGIIDLKMNQMLHPLNYSYSFKNDTIIMAAKIDLNIWNGEEAMQSLNKECYDLHKGSDGISKLWPDVDVQIKLPVNTRLQSE
ncbi:YceI family protein [Aquimarina sp. MAR_2010_214]|uniref:YceI family protein n=1 Tax=Aquimarina sp. MAR_2010_214 TaxID=1250026 RepID=UPI00130477C7|nr:YceI family protein [Aquimarina sp. MAR_2010_214]